MNAELVRTDNAMRVCAVSAERRTGPERLVLALTTLGLIASFVTFVSYQDARSQLTQNLVPTAVTRSGLYYTAHAIQILLLVSAGLAALLSTNWRNISGITSSRPNVKAAAIE